MDVKEAVRTDDTNGTLRAFKSRLVTGAEEA